MWKFYPSRHSPWIKGKPTGPRGKVPVARTYSPDLASKIGSGHTVDGVLPSIDGFYGQLYSGQFRVCQLVIVINQGYPGPNKRLQLYIRYYVIAPNRAVPIQVGRQVRQGRSSYSLFGLIAAGRKSEKMIKSKILLDYRSKFVI